MRALSLFGFLFVFWLALSGHYSLRLVGIGAACAALCVFAAVRLGILDAVGHPAHLLRRVPAYHPWLLVEIFKSALGVARIVVDPRLPISPTLTVVTATQRTAPGLATYANSITLTPGTLTVAVEGPRLTVHALTEAGAKDLEQGEMDRRVTRFEGAR